MSLDTPNSDIRRDANLTPSRFLLECGAFTPGFGLNLESYNPFDASYKFLNTGTPKAESNPFDISFRVPSSSVSVPNNVNQNQSSVNEGQKQQQTAVRGHQQQQRAFDRHPWADMMFDEVPMPMPHMSPGLSSASSTSSPTSPPLDSPPTHSSSLEQFPSITSQAQLDAHGYTNQSMFSFDTSKERQSGRFEYATTHSPRNPATINPSQAFSEQADLVQSGAALRSSHEDESDFEQPVEHDAHSDRHMSEYPEDSEMATELPGLRTQHGRQSSMMSNASANLMDDAQDSSGEPYAKKSKDRKAAPKTTKVSKTKKTADASSNKSKASGKPSSRKRSSQDQESPEVKRQKFLERNRMAASKCREKKRLQTMKTISDADEITVRNQQLHESLGELQEEVRFLKNQILAHRNCGCDVIQKFLQTSYDYNGSQSSPSPLASMHY
ncbi:hypothetical protein EMPS_01926 [Entomortierella parvispora]|uniref:BZIP domain-containing protein n=1 Tax=Entomortierella parvispora TaxID=205924 RepID=A0A9P3LT48_9FUNG|nr:hypothetical protein EMPS_01926 [Entomortierella parvispora]